MTHRCSRSSSIYHQQRVTIIASPISISRIRMFIISSVTISITPTILRPYTPPTVDHWHTHSYQSAEHYLERYSSDTTHKPHTHRYTLVETHTHTLNAYTMLNTPFFTKVDTQSKSTRDQLQAMQVEGNLQAQWVVNVHFLCLNESLSTD